MVRTLFDDPPSFDRDAFAAGIARLAAQNILMGGSSWKYEGWLDQIYTPERYYTRGRFSKKLFDETCIAEYSSVFPTVCGDFAFYQFPTDEFWQRLFNRVPPGFQFAFKVPEQITCRIFPLHARYGTSGGSENTTFLDIDLFREAFARPLERYQDRTGVLIFEFGAFPPRAFGRVHEFLDLLEPFLEKLPRGFRFAVEIRNPEFLGPDYFSALQRHNVAHVYNAWTRMPELGDQIAMPDSRTADFMVTRALLRQGCNYEDAVREFQPYSEVREINEPARRAIREIIQIARDEGRTVFIFVNNRLEGNAPGTMVSILDE